MDLKIEKLEIRNQNEISIVDLPPLTEEQKKIINPIVPPTSGIRMVILDKENDSYTMSAVRQCMFLRIFKAVSEIAKIEIKKDIPSVLLVSDDRLTANKLVEYYSKILAYDGYKIYFQTANDIGSQEAAKNEPFYSRMGTPHASASVALFDEIDLVIVITASHNNLIWNGVKFYINLPMPISGGVMQSVSNRALEICSVPLKNDISVQYIDADGKNNDYIIDIVSKVIDISILKSKKIILWPYMGKAPELVDLFQRVGVDVHLVEQEMEPPNPTVNIDYDRIEVEMKKAGTNIVILLDSDRDRIVFVLKNQDSNKFETLLPNSLYTAMHSILAKDYNRSIINVRTIPSDPRADKYSKLNIVTGVGYKHLGMILYGAIGQSIDPLKFETGILYVDSGDGYQKISSITEISQIFNKSELQGKNIILVLWEESGGHTINLLNISQINGNVKIEPVLTPIGDKYPAEALLILSALISKGYNLNDVLDQSIVGTRKIYDANDEMKMTIVESFSKLQGKTLSVNDILYNVKTFEQVNGKITIIHLFNELSNLFLRPSGTGPGVRIYIFGQKDTVENELNSLMKKIDDLVKN